MKFFEKILKGLDVWDISLIKISVFFFTLWLISLIPAFAIWTQKMSHWVFLFLWIVFAIRPMVDSFFKKTKK